MSAIRNNVEFVKTGLYTQRAENLLKIVVNELANYKAKYYMPNDKILDKCPLTIFDIWSLWFYDAQREVVISTQPTYYDTLIGQFISESKPIVKMLVANLIKRFVSVNFGESNSSDEIKMHTTTLMQGIVDSYCQKRKISKLELQLICDVLEGNDISKYKKSLVKKIVGEELSPLKYEMLVSGDAEIKDINRKYHDMIVKLKDEHRRLANGIEVKAHIEMLELQQNFKKKIAAVMKEKKAKLKEVKSLMSL